MKVVCIGAGYVGCVTAAAFAALGHETTVVDIDPRKTEMISAGKSPLFEPDLEELIRLTAARQTLRSSLTYEPVREAEAVFICVGTPSLPDGSADLTYVRKAAEALSEYCNPGSYKVIVTKSTVPVGTADLVASLLEEKEGLHRGTDFSTASNPEFLREGMALKDVFFPERVIVGVQDDPSRAILQELYRPLLERRYDSEVSDIVHKYSHNVQSSPLYLETDIPSAELIKYCANAFLAVKISFINEMARLCEALGADIRSVAKGIGSDSRIGSQFLQVSSGWSGSCFPKDTAELLATGLSYNCKLPLVKAAVQSNEDMHRFCVDKVKGKLKSLHGRTIGILGLTFKPDTDDARDTQAKFIIVQLLRLGASVKVHDPQGMPMFRRVNPELPVQYCDDPAAAAFRTDAVLLLTHWKQYRELDWRRIAASMRKACLFDLRNDLNPTEMIAAGFDYEGIGLLHN